MTIPFVPGVFWLGAVMVAYTLLWHALLPQFEGVALSHLAARGGDYTRVRLWGSIGFIGRARSRHAAGAHRHAGIAVAGRRVLARHGDLDLAGARSTAVGTDAQRRRKRTEERRVGTECVSTGVYRWAT